MKIDFSFHDRTRPYLENWPEHYLWMRARIEAADYKLPFTIDVTDIRFPRTAKASAAMKLTLKDQRKGFVPGNIKVQA